MKLFLNFLFLETKFQWLQTAFVTIQKKAISKHVNSHGKEIPLARAIWRGVNVISSTKVPQTTCKIDKNKCLQSIRMFNVKILLLEIYFRQYQESWYFKTFIYLFHSIRFYFKRYSLFFSSKLTLKNACNHHNPQSCFKFRKNEKKTPKLPHDMFNR